MPPGIWTEATTVRAHEVTPRGTASVPALCMYLQEAAGHHADALGVSIQSLQDEGKAWVLAHLRVQIAQAPRWEDDLTIETWPSGLEGLRATREFVLWKGDTAVARATSAWLVFDIESRRPARPPRRVHDIELPDRTPVLNHDWDELAVPDRTDHERTFEVRYHDLDVNRHANNLRVLEWALETLPASHLETHRCTEVALQFRAETTLGDAVRATAHVEQTDNQTHVRHALVREETDQILTGATTRWVPAA